MADDRAGHRKVYAKGYFDGLEAAEKNMTPAKLQMNLNGQTSVAKKVFEMVPVQEPWTPMQISSALTRATKSNMDFKILQGCLNTLKDSGLVREPTRGHFQRVEVKEKTEEKTITLHPAPAKPITVTTKPAAKTPIEILSEISGRLVGVNSEIKKIASDIETAAIVIEEGMAANDENIGKLKQLQSILKSLAD